MKYLAFIVAAILLGVSLASAQDLAQKVDYTTVATPLPRVLDELSKRTHVTLQCSKELDGEPVILRFDQVPLQQAMDRIAEVFVGEWVKRGDVYELQPKDVSALHQQAIQERAKRIADAINDYTAMVKFVQLDQDGANAVVHQYATLEQTGKNTGPAEMKLPSNTFGAELMKHLDPVALASIRVGYFGYFATDPNELEQPLRDADGVIQEFEAQETEIQTAIANEKIADEGLRDILSQNFGQMPKDGKLRIVVIATRNEGYMSFSFKVMDSEDRMVVEPVGTFIPLSGAKVTPDPSDPYAKELEPYSPLSKEMYVVQHAASEYQQMKLPDDAQQVILHPTTTDPLSMQVSDIVLGHAEANHLNAVCVPTDSCLEASVESTTPQGFGYTAFLGNAAFRDSMHVEEHDGWYLGRPADPGEIRTTRMPRQALEDFLGASADHTKEIEPLAILAEEAPPPIDKHLINDIIEMRGDDNSTRLSMRRNFTVDSLSAIHLWSSLSDSQLKQAQAGPLSLQVSGFDSDQQETVTRWLMNDHFPIDILGDLSTPVFEPIAAELLGEGIPANTTLVVKDDTTAVYFVTNKEGVVLKENYQTLPMLVVEREQAAKDPSKKFDFDLDSFHMGGSRSLDISLLVAGKYQAEEVFRDLIPAAGKAMTLDEVVASFSAEQRAEYEKILDQMRKRFSDAGSLRDGGGNPPPPPGS